MIDRRRFLVAGLGAGVMAAIGFPASRAFAAPKWFTGLVDGVAVGGYDPVAYFSDGEAVQGDPAIAAEHDGVTWYFASDANRAAFLVDPAKYAPQYGGHCAFAAAQGYEAKGDPRVWSIVDGKLYLNYSPPVQSRWNEDQAGNIASADQKWPGLVDH